MGKLLFKGTLSGGLDPNLRLQQTLGPNSQSELLKLDGKIHCQMYLLLPLKSGTCKYSCKISYFSLANQTRIFLRLSVESKSKNIVHRK